MKVIFRTGNGGSGSSTTSATSSNKPVSVAHRVGTYVSTSTVDANHQAVTYKVRHYANVKSGMYRLAYGNFYANSTTGDTDGANDIVVGASIEDASGNIYVAKFNGQKNVTLPPGSFILSDPIAVFFNQGDVFYTRNYVSVSAGQKYPVGIQQESGSNEGLAQGDITASGTITPTAPESNCFHPLFILGNPDPSVSNNNSSVLFLGDSITAGVGANYYGNSYAHISGQLFRRGILVGAVTGDKGSSFSASPSYGKYRMLLAQYATHAVIAFGANDLGVGNENTAIQIQGYNTVIANRLIAMGLKVYLVTIPPRTTSTDGYATTVNQTPSTGYTGGATSERAKYNAWVRTKPAPFTDYIELADIVESGRDTGLWKPLYTTDGYHPNATSHPLMANAVNLHNMISGISMQDTVPPSVPTNLSVTISNSAITLTWTKSPEGDLAGYNVYRGGTKINGSLLTTTSYSDTGLTNDTAYNYQVASVDYAGNESAKTSIISATPGVPTSIVYDSFTGTNSTNVLGDTEGGSAGIKSWTTLAGTAGINSNQGYFSAGSETAAVVDSLVADGNVEVKINVTAQYSRLLFRVTDASNYLFVQNSGTGTYQLYKKVGGAFTLLRTSSGVTPTAGDTVKVQLSGNLIRVFINGVELTAMSVNESFNATATQHGIGVGSGTTTRFDEFKVY